MRPRIPVRSVSTLPLFALALLLVAPAASAQQYLGPSKCVGCHDHERQAQKWQKEEPATLKGKAHFNTLKQLDAPKSAGWAKAIGLADPYDVKGSCVKCHATVFRGDANAGVSCESCHGPSSGWNDLHQQKGSYQKSVAAGMKDLKEKPPTIAKTCVDCHLTTDAKLAAAGHPTGATFDAGASLQKLVHWNTAYNFAQVAAAGKAAMAGRAPAGAPPAAATPPKAAAAPPAAAPAAPAGKAPAAAPPAAGGPAAQAPTAPVPAAPAPAPPAKTRPAAPAAPAAPPAPWDWDQPVRALPDDYVPEPVAEPEAPAPAAPEPGTAAPAAPAPPAAPRAPRPPRAPAVPPSLAEESPLPGGVAGTSTATALAPSVAPAEPAPAAPRTPASQVAELRGKGVQIVERLLRSGARAADAPAPAKPAEFKGPDSELLRLQDEVLALALEALRRPEP
jgi:hypothetical protein